MEHGTPEDLPLAIPGSGPPDMPAGGDPVPMSTEAINQPVVAYFTFIQNNIAQIASGNATQVMREAEQRHLQIMHEVIGQLRTEWMSRLAAREQEFEQRLHEAEADAVQALENVKSSHQAEVEKLKSDANKMHDHALENERARLATEFEASINHTIDHAKSSIESLKKECDDKVAVEQAKYIQVKAEFEKFKAEVGEKLSEAEAQNLSLQDTIDDLQDQLEILKKRVHGTAATGDGAPAVAKASTDVHRPETFNISTPKAPGASGGGDADVILEIKTPAVLAAEAKAKLDKLLSPSKPTAETAHRHTHPQNP
eukprot:s1013_g6.t1